MPPRHLIRIVLVSMVALAAVNGEVEPVRAQLQLQLEPVVGGLDLPIGIAHAGDGSGRLFVVLQRGKIVAVQNGVVQSPDFLDVTGLVSCCGEQGLLGLAFHPQFASNGFFYVNYTDTAGGTVIARYHVPTGSPVADPGSRFQILRVNQPFPNHNGGQLQFGPDGYLYIGMGDGGSGGDPGNRAQRLDTLLGKQCGGREQRGQQRRGDPDHGDAVRSSEVVPRVTSSRRAPWARASRAPSLWA